MRSFVFGRTHRLGRTVLVAACLLPLAAGAADSGNSPAPKPEAASTQQAAPSTHAWPIRLQHLKPTNFLKVCFESASSCPLPLTVQSITPDDTQNSIIVHGDEADVLKVMEIVRLLDVAPRQVKLIVRFTRAPDADHPASFVQPVLAVAVVQVQNNEPVDVSVFADHHLLQAHITPHINGDDSVSLATSLTSQAAGEPLHNADASTDAAIRARVVQSSLYVGPTWYRRVVGIAPSELRENGGKIDPINEKTISYGGNINIPGNIYLPPQGDYAVSVAPVLESLQR